MPQKLKYHVLGCTGEAEGYSSRNLEEQSPTALGWQTPRFCVYPQEIIFKIAKPVAVKKLQILSHQYMIPTKIEFYISHDDAPQSFKKLGYIYLSSNEKTGFKSRELKSVHIDAAGQYLRLIVHKNHINKFNLYNQVSLIAFNAIGDYLKRDGNVLDLRNVHENDTIDYFPQNKPDYISPMDDLAFDMYQDPEVAQIIRRLDDKKKLAVVEENFDSAKKIKQAIADLQKVGEKLGRYELDKRKAIEEEDYDLAKSKKAQMQEYRLKVYQQLKNHGLMNELKEVAQSPEAKTFLNESGSHSTVISPRPSQFSPVQNQVFSGEYSNNNEVTLTERYSHENSPSHAQNTFNNEVLNSPYPNEAPTQQYQTTPEPTSPKIVYDERVIPALNKNKSPTDEPNPFLDESGGPVSPRNVQGSEPEAMSEKNIREAASAIDVFGLSLVSGAYSKTFSFREDALLAVYKKLKEIPQDTPKEEVKDLHRASLFLVKKTIRDKVQSVCNASLRVLELILTDFIPHHKLGKGDITFTLNKVLPPLVQKTGETAARSRNAAINFIEEMAQYPSVHPTHIIPSSIVQPFTKETAQRLALSKVQICGNLLGKSGIEPPALTVETVMKMCNSGLEHTSGAVREATMAVIFQLYKISGQAVKAYLPHDEPATRKNTLYRHIFDEFDRLDGKPTQAELKAQRQKDEKKKQQEINQLQDQINQLKLMNEEVAKNKGQGAQPSTSKAQDTKQKQPAQEANQPIDDLDENSSAYLENMCIFCAERDDSFNEQGLDLHYWKHCPMLKRCEHCKQVVEIAGYTEHLLTECENHAAFGKCPRCTEAIPVTELQQHLAAKSCKICLKDKNNRCPMCHNNIPFGEDAWKDHLMGTAAKACPANSRRQESINRLKAKSLKKPPNKAKKGNVPQKPARKR